MRRLVTVLGAVALVASTTVTAAANPWETEDIFGQGLAGPVVAVDGAKINRGATGLTVSVSMPTPAPGYTIPGGATSSGLAGHPEAFSLWAIVFFNPGACSPPGCDMLDVTTNPNVVAGGYNAGGHLVGGSNLTMSGRVNAQSKTFGGPNAESIAYALANGYTFAGADIHIAVAPHGALAPELLPAQITTPAGGPAQWWLAIFD